MPRRDRPGPYNLDMLRALPAPALFETDAKVLEALLVAWFEGETGRTLYPMQVEMLLIEMLAYLWSLLATEAKVAHLQRYAVLADEAWLEQLGADVTTPRLDPSKALTTARFALAAPAASNVIVPKNTRVSAGSAGTVFLTDTDLVIGVGAATGDVGVTAETAGAVANGLAVGTITVILDPIAGVASVANLTVSDGGADREDLDLYRIRVVNALEKVSEAGPRQGYAEHVMDVSPAIIDVAVIRPQPCYIDIYPLTESGPAGPDLRAFVLASLDPETLRPMGDLVTVKPPIAVTYTLTINVKATADLARVQAAALAAAQDITGRWRRQLGGGEARGVSDSEIVSAVRAILSVVHVDVPGFEFLSLAEWEFPVPTGITVNVTQAGAP